MAPWPPGPRSVIRSECASDMVMPARNATIPVGMTEVTWKPISRASVHDRERPRLDHRLGAARAPPRPAGTGRCSGRAGPRAATPARTPRRASSPTWTSWPHACIRPSTSDGSGVDRSSWTGNASMSPRSTTVRPGRPPSMAKIPPVSVVRNASGIPSEAMWSRISAVVSVLLERQLGPAVHRRAAGRPSRRRRRRRGRARRARLAATSGHRDPDRGLSARADRGRCG